MSELPKGWVDASIGEVTDPFTSIDPRKNPKEIFRYIDIGSIDNKIQTVREPKEFLGQDAPSRARRLVQTGDVLFSTVRTYLKNVAQVPDELDGALTSTGISVLRPSDGIDGRYLFRWVCSDNFIDEISKTQDGTMYPAVSDKDVAAGHIPIPPSLEQRRIAIKLDSLSARTRRAREELDRIPFLIEHYKRSVLAAAFSGELTREWRNVRDLDDPETTKLGAQVSDVRYGTSKKCHVEPRGIPVLRIPNVSAGRVNLNDLKFAELPDRELRKLQLQAGDILVVRSNGSVDLVGRPALVSEAESGFAYAGYLIRLRPRPNDVLPPFLAYMLNAPQVRAKIETGVRSTSGVHNVNATELAGLVLPLPGLPEQKEIVRRIDAAFVWLEKLEGEYVRATQLLPKLEAALLTKAFSGNLVPQDPNDEPATVLLERIRAEREKIPRVKRASRKERANKGPKKTTRGRKNVMGKKRSDVERDHLRKTLNGLGGTAPAKEVWQRSEMDIDEFYKQLRAEVKAGHIREGASKDQLELADAA